MAVSWRLQGRGAPRRYPFHRKYIGDDCTCGVLTAEDLNNPDLSQKLLAELVPIIYRGLKTAG